MADIIVVLIVIVLLGFALRGAIRHFKGDSPCCGGGTGIIKTDDKELKICQTRSQWSAWWKM